MAIIPRCVTDYPFTAGRNSEPVVEFLARFGFNLIHRGKVRDTYSMPDDPDKYLVVASDRLSIFDFVLPVTVPGKGVVLTALTHFWLTRVLEGRTHHLVSSVHNERFNAAYGQKLFTNIAFPLERALVIKKVKIQPFELIFRHHLGGSVWKKYVESGIVAGVELPKGLKRWSFLEQPLFTPLTKAENGHDINVTQAEYLAVMGVTGQKTVNNLLQVYQQAYDWAYQRGIIILDTKFEAGDPYVLADEVLTPDSSRFTTVEDYEAAMRENRDPIFFDKEPARTWGRTVSAPFGVTGINNLDPDNPDHVRFVHEEVKVPPEVVADLAMRYRRLFEMLTCMFLYYYQVREMGININ